MCIRDRCGYLGRHPQIRPGRRKEVMHFDRLASFERGEDHYMRSFPIRKPWGPRGARSIDATPEYLFREGVAARIHEFEPSAKILVCLREPISRAFSHWNMFRQIFEKNFDEMWSGFMDDADPAERTALWSLFHREQFPNFEEAVREDIEAFQSSSNCSEPSFVRRGIYQPQVKAYLDQFGPENVLTIGSRDLRDSTAATLGSIVHFLRLDPFTFETDDLRPVHARAYDLAPSQDVIDTLTDFYRPHNTQLEDLLGGLPNW